jgi:hypothetical protein
MENKEEFFMATTWRPAKSVEFQSKVGKAKVPYSASLVDVFDGPYSMKSQGTIEEAALELGYRKAVIWLVSSTAFVGIVVGIFGLAESTPSVMSRSEEARYAAEALSSRGIVTLGQALQTMNGRR